MRHHVVLILVTGLLLGIAQATQAVETRSVTLALTTQTDAALQADYVEFIAPTSLPIAAGAKPVSAYIELRVALEPGQEVELWQDTGTERLPWERYEDYGLRKAHWLADERTGSLVRLDVTGLLRGWLAETETGSKLLIRLAPDGEEAVADLKPVRAATATLVIRAW